MTVQKSYPLILILGSLVGLLASFFLTLDTFQLFQNPNATLPCNLNPFINCAASALSNQGQVFGFPNPLLGLIAFSMLLAIGVMLYAGGRAKRSLWLLVNLGLLAAFLFCNWFIFESLYRLGKLCLYCMTVWFVTWPLFLYTTVWNIQEDHLKIKNAKIKDLLNRHHGAVLLAWYLLIIFLILLRFKQYFLF